MITHQVDQKSDEWLALRAGCITASRAKDARLRNKPTKADPIGAPSGKMLSYAKQVAVERISKTTVDRFFETAAMREGVVQEPFCRMAYEAQTGNLASESGFVTTDDGLYGYSTDGEIGDDGLLECKALFSSERIVDLIGAKDVSDFRDQCLMGMWITGRKWVDVALWAPALENIGRKLTIVRIERNEAEIELFEQDMMAFKAIVDGYEQQLLSM